MKVVIIKYNAGNCASVNFALERIGVSAIISENFEEIRSADKVIFPGVGAAGSAMQYLREKKLDQLIINLKQPVLGICLGLQPVLHKRGGIPLGKPSEQKGPHATERPGLHPRNSALR